MEKMTNAKRQTLALLVDNEPLPYPEVVAAQAVPALDVAYADVVTRCDAAIAVSHSNNLAFVRTAAR